MAKSSNKGLVELLAFASLIISAVCFILGIFGIGSGMLNTIAYICLLIVVLWVAWNYACHLSKTWRIIYFIIAILAIVGFVFGNFHIL